MRLEPELLDAKLRAMGCPFAADDLRATYWLDGFKAGVCSGFRDAAKAMNLSVDGLAA